MSRTAHSPWILLGMLAVGVVLGMAVDRRVQPISAQATNPPRGQAAPPPAEVPAARPVGEDAIYQQLARQYEYFQPVNRTFELVAKAVSPAVVHIVARKAGSAHESDRSVSYYEETGSGVIVRPERGAGLYVLTNNHVIDGAVTADVNIVLHDGRVLHPLRTWSDTKADIAVLRLGRDDLPSARLGNSDDVPVGTWVLALGSPFGLTHSVSQGIISARGRHEDELQEEGVENQDFLQTDAAINPGNSGGPLVNLKGEVIGINTAIASNGGGSEGVGFSIPINLARWIMGQLVTSGKVSRGAMGIHLHPDLKHDRALALGLDRPRGAWVLSVGQPSPAWDAGVRDGDVIIKFNGIDVIDLNHLINMVSMSTIGQTVEVVIWRDRKELAKRVRIADQDAMLVQSAGAGPDRPGPNGLIRRPQRPPGGSVDPSGSAAQAIGLDLTALDSAAAARRLGLADSVRGVAVVQVDPTSPLYGSLKAFDILYSVDGQVVQTPEEALRALSRRGTRAPLELKLQRLINGSLQWQSIRVPR